MRILTLLLFSVLVGCTSSSDFPLSTGLEESPSVTAPIDGILAGFASGSFDNFANGALTRQNTATLTLNFITDKAGLPVSIYFDRYCQSPIKSTTVGPGASTLIGLTFAADGSDDGKYNIFFRFTDSSATSCASTGLSFTLDTRAPANITSRLSLNGIANNGYSNNTSPVIEGAYLSSEKGTVVDVYDDSLCTNLKGTGTTQADGTVQITGISYTAVTDDGLKDFFARLTDLAGNVLGCHKLFLGYHLDTVAPANPTGTYNLDLGWDTFQNRSKTTTPTLQWGSPNYSDGDRLFIYPSSTCSGTPHIANLAWPKPGTIYTAAANFASDGSEDGLKNFAIRLVDLAGNTSGCVDIAKSYTLDRTRPTVAFDVASIPVLPVRGPFLLKAAITEDVRWEQTENSGSGASGLNPPNASTADSHWSDKYVSVSNGRAYVHIIGKNLHVYVEPATSGPVEVAFKASMEDAVGNTNLPSNTVVVNYLKPIEIQFEKGSQAISEKAGTASVKIVASSALTEDATIAYEVLSGSTATSSHFTFASGSVTMPSGSTEITLTVPVLDSTDAFNRHVLFGIKSVTSATTGLYSLGNLNTHRLIIQDDETAPLSFKKLGKGDQFTCGLRSDNKLYCWGKNNVGQLGTGNNTDYTTPQNITPATTYLDIAVGADSACAVDSANDVYCWGNNPNKQVSSAVTASFNSPQLRDAGVKYQAIFSTDGSETLVTYCGLTTANKIRCWGYNGSGIVGTGTISSSENPIAVDAAEDYVQISMHSNHVCAVNTTNKMKCWGQNGDYQINNTWTSSFLTPLSVGQGATTNIKKVSVGSKFTCAINTADELYCWGSQSNYRMGRVSNQSYYTLRIDSPNLFKDIRIGAFGGCGITTAGIMRCWGDSDVMSNASLNDFETIPKTIEPAIVFNKFMGSSLLNCALTNTNKPYCWGHELNGVYDNDLVLLDQTNIVKTPKKVASGATGKLFLGSRSGCYSTVAGDFYCWGSRRGIVNQDSPSAAPTLVRSLFPIFDLATDMYSSIQGSTSAGCGISTNNDLYCWGTKTNTGVLGSGYSTVDYYARRHWPVQIDIGTKYKMVRLSASHACAITTGNALKCWGDAANGQVGTGVISNYSNWVPNTVSAGTNFIDLALGASRTCAITDLNKIKCWGLSYGTTPVDVDAANSYKKITAGNGNHFCAITTANKLRCWGSSNTYGQIGAGGATLTTLVNVDNANDYLDVAAGELHTCGVTSLGDLKCWGFNGNGQIGDNSLTNVSSPKVIDGGTTYRAVSAGARNSCGITTANELKCWGRNNLSETGDGNSTRLPRLFDR